MYYAADNTIGAGNPPDGAIAISGEQYQAAFAAKMEGREALVVDGALVIRDKPPSSEHTWDNGEWVAPPEPEPEPATIDDILAERARRLALGFDHDFGDGRGVHRIGTTTSDMAGWDEVTKLASALLAAGEGAAAIQIVTDTGPCEVSAAEWQQVLLAAGAFRQPIWLASFVLQEMDPVPADYAEDHHWPPGE